MAVPNKPALLVAVAAAGINVKLVPAGTVPVILAVTLRFALPGLIAETFIHISVLEPVDAIDPPGVDVVNSKVTGAWFVSISANSDKVSVIGSPAVVCCAHTDKPIMLNKKHAAKTIWYLLNLFFTTLVFSSILSNSPNIRFYSCLTW